MSTSKNIKIKNFKNGTELIQNFPTRENIRKLNHE